MFPEIVSVSGFCLMAFIWNRCGFCGVVLFVVVVVRFFFYLMQLTELLLFLAFSSTMSTYQCRLLWMIPGLKSSYLTLFNRFKTWDKFLGLAVWKIIRWLWTLNAVKHMHSYSSAWHLISPQKMRAITILLLKSKELRQDNFSKLFFSYVLHLTLFLMLFI